jgi:hypothetical protein
MSERAVYVAMQVRVSPQTGREELVVVGGYSESLLAEMRPFTLDLDTMCWRCWPGLREQDLDTLQLPVPRQRMAANRITPTWLLISGGCPSSVRPSRALPSCTPSALPPDYLPTPLGPPGGPATQWLLLLCA